MRACSRVDPSHLVLLVLHLATFSLWFVRPTKRWVSRMMSIMILRHHWPTFMIQRATILSHTSRTLTSCIQLAASIVTSNIISLLDQVSQILMKMSRRTCELLSWISIQALPTYLSKIPTKREKEIEGIICATIVIVCREGSNRLCVKMLIICIIILYRTKSTKTIN